jgi:hypothetical protein
MFYDLSDAFLYFSAPTEILCSLADLNSSTVSGGIFRIICACIILIGLLPVIGRRRYRPLDRRPLLTRILVSVATALHSIGKSLTLPCVLAHPFLWVFESIIVASLFGFAFQTFLRFRISQLRNDMMRDVCALYDAGASLQSESQLDISDQKREKVNWK